MKPQRSARLLRRLQFDAPGRCQRRGERERLRPDPTAARTPAAPATRARPRVSPFPEKRRVPFIPEVPATATRVWAACARRPHRPEPRALGFPCSAASGAVGRLDAGAGLRPAVPAVLSLPTAPFPAPFSGWEPWAGVAGAVSPPRAGRRGRRGQSEPCALPGPWSPSGHGPGWHPAPCELGGGGPRASCPPPRQGHRPPGEHTCCRRKRRPAREAAPGLGETSLWFDRAQRRRHEAEEEPVFPRAKL